MSPLRDHLRQSHNLPTPISYRTLLCLQFAHDNDSWLRPEHHHHDFFCVQVIVNRDNRLMGCSCGVLVRASLFCDHPLRALGPALLVIERTTYANVPHQRLSRRRAQSADFLVAHWICPSRKVNSNSLSGNGARPPESNRNPIAARFRSVGLS